MKNENRNIPPVPVTSFKIGIIIGILTGGSAFVLGFLLCILGITGSMEVIVESSSVKARLINATPGAVFALLGFMVLWRYKPKKSRVVYKEETHTDCGHDDFYHRKVEYEQSDEAVLTKPNDKPFFKGNNPSIK